MKRYLICAVLSLVWALGMAVVDADAQTAWGISVVRYNTETRIVDGYSGTWLDYYAGLYYDPEVNGQLYRPDNEIIYAQGTNIGYADIFPAELYLATSNFVEGKTYCTLSKHYVWGYYYQPTANWWFDPFRYSTFAGTGGSPWPGNPFTSYWVYARRYRLGITEACIAIPIPPSPTPSPTPTPVPTPTPTPTPCNPALEGSCQLEVISVNITPQALRPSGTTGGNNIATVRGCLRSGPNTLPNRTINLRLYRHLADQNTGGHVDTLHTGPRPVGRLQRVSGTTGANGCFETKYTPPHIAEIVTVEAYVSSTYFEYKPVFVGVPGFANLGGGQNYKLIGETPSHPRNHFGTLPANNGLRLIADDYKSEFYGSNPIPENEKVAYNDMSLEFGGKFDLLNRWENTTDKHGEHREGINCDTRSSNIPLSRWARLKEIFVERGSRGTYDETTSSAPHWHLRFLPGGSSAVAERTPHMYIEDAFGAALERQSSQAEYEAWLTRLTNAKAQDQNQLLAEARALQYEIFDSAEYTARARSGDELIKDVFWSHLFREPNGAELKYWRNVLLSIEAITPEAQRMTFVYGFGQTPEFESVVLGLVDPAEPPTP